MLRQETSVCELWLCLHFCLPVKTHIHYYLTTGSCFLHKNYHLAANFYMKLPSASSTGILEAIRCEQDTHSLFKNREGPDSPTQSFTAETSVEMVSSLMTLIQSFNHCSLLCSSPPFFLSFLSRGGDFASISLLSHWIFHKSVFLFSSSHTYARSRLSHGRVLTLIPSHFSHLSSSMFASILHSSFFLSSSSQSCFIPRMLV